MYANIYFLLSYIYVLLPNTSAEITEFCDKNGDIILKGENFDLRTVWKQTKYFTCKGHKAKHITILASDKILLNKQFHEPGTLSHPFHSLALIARTIVVKPVSVYLAYPNERADRIQINVGGLHGDDKPEISTKYHAYQGADGGNFIGIARNWENTEKLAVRVTGGRAGCKGALAVTRKGDVLQYNGKKWINVIIDTHGSEPAGGFLDPACKLCLFENFYHLRTSVKGAKGKDGISFFHGANSEIIEITPRNPDHICLRPNREERNVVLLKASKFWNPGPDNYYINEAELLDNKLPTPPSNKMKNVFVSIRMWLLELANGEWSNAELLELSQTVSEAQHQQIGTEAIEMFYEELKLIIENSPKLENNFEIQLIKELRERIANYYTENEENFKNDTARKRLEWAHAGCSAQLIRMERETDLITNLLAFINPIYEDIKESTQLLNRTLMIKAAEKTYSDVSDQQIAEAVDLVNEMLLPELESIKSKLESEFQVLQADIQERIQQAKEDLKVVEENLEKANKLNTINWVLGSLKIIGAAAFFVTPPVGAIVGTAFNGLLTAGQKIAENELKPGETRGYTIPEGVSKNVRPIEDWIERKRRLLVINLNKIMQENNNVDTAEIQQQLRNAEALATEINPHVKYDKIKEIYSALQKILNLSDNPRGLELQSRTGSNSGSGGSKFKLGLDKGQEGVSELMNSANGIISDTYSGLEQVRKYEIQIDTIKADIQKMEGFSDRIHTTFLPMALGIFDTFDLAQKEFENASLASIDVTTWNVKKNLQDIQHELSKVLAGFDAGKDILHSFQGMGTTFDAVSSVYSKIAEVRERQRQANLMVELVSASGGVLPKDDITLDLIKTTIAATTAGIAERVTLAFRMWAFPFAAVFLKQIQELTVQFAPAYDAVHANALERIKLIRDVIHQYSNTINVDVDHFKKTLTFMTSQNDDPFFVWEWETHKDSILDLLNGKEVLFEANIRTHQNNKRHSQKQAIKFSEIGLNFVVTGDPEGQNRINQGLVKCDLNMVHMGLSYYKFQGKIYLFNTASVKFGTRFDAGSNATLFAGQTFSLMKYSAGDVTLSPYGLWKFSLSPIREGSTLDDLILQPNEAMNIELIGKGTAVMPFAKEVYTDPDMDKHFSDFEVVEIPENGESDGEDTDSSVSQ